MEQDKKSYPIYLIKNKLIKLLIYCLGEIACIGTPSNYGLLLI